ncbi:MAG TPA: hypothetical protein VHX38_13615 [Pseudonocardiaceae bacterium]|nr:hypothetical protein [Pseudonocardiaceae bacterium]
MSTPRGDINPHPTPSTNLSRRFRLASIGAEGHGLILGPGQYSDTEEGTPAPLPATLHTARAEVTTLRHAVAELTARLREADAYIAVVEHERDDALADADHWREQAGGDWA